MQQRVDNFGFVCCETISRDELLLVVVRVFPLLEAATRGDSFTFVSSSAVDAAPVDNFGCGCCETISRDEPPLLLLLLLVRPVDSSAVPRTGCSHQRRFLCLFFDISSRGSSNRYFRIIGCSHQRRFLCLFLDMSSRCSSSSRYFRILHL